MRLNEALEQALQTGRKNKADLPDREARRLVSRVERRERWQQRVDNASAVVYWYAGLVAGAIRRGRKR